MANALARETSPYLLQHRDNPVDWLPWGEEALRRAREEDKPLLVSIGYSACHWCHVMERESFEDPQTACRFSRQRDACSAGVSPTSSSVCGSSAICPEQNSSPPALTAWL